MAIEFKCEHCEKLIQAPDELGGNMGQCPHCGHSMYIPLPAGEASEPLELDEENPQEESQREELMAKTRQAMLNLLQDRDAPGLTGEQAKNLGETARGKAKPIDPEDAAITVEEYVVAMSRGSLDEAESLAAHLAGNPQVVGPVIAQALKRGLIHPSLNGVPLAVQKGFLKKLEEYLK